MADFSLKQVLEIVNGKLLNTYDEDIVFNEYHFDSREISKNSKCLFFAVQEKEWDGHDYLDKLNGIAAGAVVSRDVDCSVYSFPLIKVDNTMHAVQALASHIRETFNDTVFIGITGSAGKTSTKEFLYQILSADHKSFRSCGNWNNWLGLPFSMLMMKGDEKSAVFEMGMSSPGIGEIDHLGSLLRPDYSIILNVFPVHLEYLKTVENIAAAKCEIIRHTQKKCFVNSDFKELENIAEKSGNTEFFSRENQSSIRLTDVSLSEQGTMLKIKTGENTDEYVTNLTHNNHIENLFASLVVASESGMNTDTIRKSIRNLVPVKNRGGIIHINGIEFTDETYNSNPAALKKSLEWFLSSKGSKNYLVIGDMLELGRDEDMYHREIGVFLRDYDFEELILVGPLSENIEKGFNSDNKRSIKVSHFDMSVKAGEYLRKTAKSGSRVFLKASRGIRLERVFEVYESE